MSGWVKVGQCSKECGVGTQVERRSMIRQDWGGGDACGATERTVSCHVKPCPSDCVPGAWTPWSVCSQPCGNGTQTRTRPIERALSDGGAPCTGMTETLVCNPHKCTERDCSHVQCLVDLTTKRITIQHDKHETNGWHHFCRKDVTAVNDCRCTCTHKTEEFDPFKRTAHHAHMARVQAGISWYEESQV
jgi:hypothetical protein